MKTDDWTLLDEDAGVLVRAYPFTKGALSTTFVFRGTDGLVVVSPARGLAPRDYDALREHGEIRALVANNAFHHLGQAEWRARFPDATSFAPAASIARLRKQAKDIPFAPLETLALPEAVRCESIAGYKTGETLVRVRTRASSIWYAGDLLANFERLPPPPAKWLFRATDSAPGFKLFKMAVWMMIADRPRVRAFMLERIAEAPPTAIVPAHGEVFRTGDVADAVRTQLARL